MKSLMSILFSFVCLSLNAAEQPSEQQINLTMRQIGNRVLWAAGDSTTRILPVHQSEKTYTIRFEKPTPINYDSIVRITSFELSKIDIHDFLTEIKGCGNDEIYLSFAIQRDVDTITPCLGRTMSNLCYEIAITLTEKKMGIKDVAIPVLLLALLSSSFLLSHFRKKREQETSSNKQTENNDKIMVGSYFYLENKSQLQFNDSITPLSDKENILISILIKNVNQPVTRELLMDEIWGTNGVLVLSRNIDVLVSKLRKKLVDDPSIKITNVHGVGYRLEIS